MAVVQLAHDALNQARRALSAGNTSAAIAMLDEVLRRHPENTDALALGGYILQTCGQSAGALRFYDRVLSLRPEAAVWFNRGVLLLGVGAAEAALESFSAACVLAPENASYHSNRGAAFYDLGRLAEAVEAYAQALARDPGFAEAALNLGNAYMRLGAYHKAHDAYLRAISLRPHYAAAFCGRGIVAKELGNFDEARAAFHQALTLMPDSAEALSNLGCLDLLLGDFAAGWEGYEYRWAHGARPVPQNNVQFDLARPETIAGRKILIVNDHGLGDTIQFFRYVILLAKAGAEVHFAAPKKIRRLLDSSGVAINWRDEQDFAGAFDEILAISSLPRAFATRLDSIPTTTPYIFAEADPVAGWRECLAALGPGLRVGLCWRGNVDFRVDPRRSIPPEFFAPLAQTAGVRLISLQKGAPPPAALAENLVMFSGIDDGADAFIDTAAIMMSLDLIVTCDTSIAHLAGAMGRPVWVALRHISEWRWLTDRADSPWYPGMRLFRCGIGDDWGGVVSAMAAEVKKLQSCG